jgi:integrase
VPTHERRHGGERSNISGSDATKLRSIEPLHYLIPFRLKKGTYDPQRPAKGWRYALNEMLVTAGVHISGYSFRHHAITKLLETPNISEETAESIAGHISQRIKKRYSHVRLEAKRAAVEALDRIAPKPVTDHRTKRGAKLVA